jgi:hypothetical protein
VGDGMVSCHAQAGEDALAVNNGDARIRSPPKLQAQIEHARVATKWLTLIVVASSRGYCCPFAAAFLAFFSFFCFAVNLGALFFALPLL